MTIAHRISAILVAAALLPCAAVAQPICRQLDIPGASYTQPFQINNSGQLVAGSNLGTYVYSAGIWQALPAPPAGSGFTASNLAGTALNDYGVIGGAAFPDSGGPEQSYLFAFGQYTFFSYPSSTLVNTEARGLNNKNQLTVLAFDNSNSLFGDTAFVYNPLGAPGYPQGYTALAPTLNGRASTFTIAQQINDAGQVVGSGRFPGFGVWSFLYDPAAAQPYTLFRASNGSPTRARGINNRGEIAGAVNAPNGFSGFFRDAAGDHYFDCPELNATSIFPTSINDRGLIAGGTQDSLGTLQHAFIAYPDAGAVIADLRDAVDTLDESHGIDGRLGEKLEKAAEAFDEGDSARACKALASFVAEVAKDSAKQRLPAEQAASFTAEAQAAQRGLGCK